MANTKKMYTINIYDKEGKVVKTAEAQAIKLKFGTVKNLFKVLKIENATDTAELFETIYNTWDEVLAILSQIFPDVTEDELDNVVLDELIPTVIAVVKDSITVMGKSISSDEGNK